MWKKIFIENIETNYSVNEIGEVKNNITNKILTPRIQQGYKHITLYINKKPKSVKC